MTQAPAEPRESADFSETSISMMELSFVTMTPPSSAKNVSFNTLFEGQFIEERTGEKKNGGAVALITNFSQLSAYLSAHSYDYADENGIKLNNVFSREYFETHDLLVSSCTFSDTGYYTTVASLCADDGNLYINDSLSYSKQRSGEYYCHTLSVYEIKKDAVTTDLTLSVY